MAPSKASAPSSKIDFVATRQKLTASSASRRATTPAPQKSNLKRRPSVSFSVATPTAYEEDNLYQDELDEDEDEENGAESMMDMLSILQEYQKKKSSKSSTRAAAIEAKKKAINDDAYAEIAQMKEEGAAYIQQVKTKVDELKEQQVSPETSFADVTALFGNRLRETESQLDFLAHFLSELSPARTEIIEANSTELHSHKASFEKTRKKIMKKARKDLQSGMEQQKLATDAQAYIKHFKHLVQM